MEIELIRRSEIHNIINYCENTQDGAMFGLIFEGVYGINLEELVCLKKEDCDTERGRIKLTSKLIEENGGINLDNRIISINDMGILSVIEDAIDQQLYVRDNGIGFDGIPYCLAETEYVFRSNEKKDRGKIDGNILNDRIDKIIQSYGYFSLNIKSVWFSGLIDYAKQLKEKYDMNYISKELYEEINKKYDYKNQDWLKGDITQIMEKYI